MARSHAIWVVTNPAKVSAVGPLACFTVKHECASWLDRHFTPGLKLFRCDDNPSDYREEPTVTELDLDEFRRTEKARDERTRAADEIWRASVSFQRGR